MSDLKPCPFCGRKAVKVGFHNGVQCPTAYCAGNAMVVEPSQWNRRAQPDTRKWRPIETAPKQCYPNIIVADIRTGDVWTDWWDYDCECWANAGESNIAPPTHWMPAPNPPAAIRAQQEEGE